MGLSQCSDSSVNRRSSRAAMWGVLVPALGVEPTPPALKGRLLTSGPPGQSPCLLFQKGSLSPARRQRRTRDSLASVLGAKGRGSCFSLPPKYVLTNRLSPTGSGQAWQPVGVPGGVGSEGSLETLTFLWGPCHTPRAGQDGGSMESS